MNNLPTGPPQNFNTIQMFLRIRTSIFCEMVAAINFNCYTVPVVSV